MCHRGTTDWTLIVLTCQHKDSVYAFQRELELRQRWASIAQHTLVLTVSDTQECLGSGGATLNALLVATEHLSARARHTVVSADVLDNAHILILHMGRDFPWDPCSRAFCCLPEDKRHVQVEQPVCCVDVLLNCLTHQICPGSPPGVWVCSTDMILDLLSVPELPWDGFSGVCVLAMPGDVSFATRHGVYLADEQGNVCDIIYRGSEDRIRQALQPDGKVPLVSGPVFFCRDAAERLLQTHVSPPLDGCTYLGMDSGAPSLQLSLFLDILLCLCVDVSENRFVEEERPGCSSPAGLRGALVRNGRKVLWRALRGTRLTMVYVPDGYYDYMTMSGDEHIRRLTTRGSYREVLSHVQSRQSVSHDSRVINSVLEGDINVSSGTVIQHCHLQGPLQIAPGCLLSGLDVSSCDILQASLPSDIIIQKHRLQLGELTLHTYTVFGRYDDLEVSHDAHNATYLNQPWETFWRRTEVQPAELWGPACEHTCLLDARLFPVFLPSGDTVGAAVGMVGVAWLLGGAGSVQQWRSAWKLSLREALACSDQQGELRWREELLMRAARGRVVTTLRGRMGHTLLPSIRAAVCAGKEQEMLHTLDMVAAESSEDLGVAARSLACIADVLGCMAGNSVGGLRSGPAANPLWATALSLLESGDLQRGVRALVHQRDKWLSRPDLLVRAARHYEGAGQVLLRQAVMSSQQFVSIGRTEAPPIGQWQKVECPARLDLAGGWSDTPPIAFEFGGCVVNLAIRVDGKRPIGARARRIAEPQLLLVSTSGVTDSAVTMETVCETLKDLQDYCQPHAPGALLKAVCVCSNLVSLTCQQSLEEQLLQRWGGGLELHTWSLLPHGSGLGTSSILAGAALAAVYTCTGHTFDRDSLIHAVLHLEQALTTGGGWQDQVGGLVGGIKVARSAPCLPLRVTVEPLNVTQDFLQSLQQRLLLVYTGKTRLARNLLQDVVRSWYSRLPAIVHNAEELVNNAEECVRACAEGSWQAVGKCVQRYWQQKKGMSPGCEPASVRVMMDVLQPLCVGQSLAGAGGGGFLYIITHQTLQREKVESVLNSTQGLGGYSVHSVEIDMDGVSLQCLTDPV